MRRKSTRNIDVGDRIDLPGRSVIVTNVDVSGISVIWFDNKGQGPHHGVLPHGDVTRTRYIDERNTDRSWWETNPTMTGKTGEI